MSIEGHSIHGLFVVNLSNGTSLLHWEGSGEADESVVSVVWVDVGNEGGM